MTIKHLYIVADDVSDTRDPAEIGLVFALPLDVQMDFLAHFLQLVDEFTSAVPGRTGVHEIRAWTRSVGEWLSCEVTDTDHTDEVTAKLDRVSWTTSRRPPRHYLPARDVEDMEMVVCEEDFDHWYVQFCCHAYGRDWCAQIKYCALINILTDEDDCVVKSAPLPELRVPKSPFDFEEVSHGS